MDLVPYVEGMGYAVRVYQEWGVSGTTLAQRPKANSMLGDLQAGRIQGIAVAELSRLARDVRGLDAAFIADQLIRYAHGRLITYGRVFDLRRSTDWMLYQTLTMIAGWQRLDIRNTLYSGTVKAASRQPIFKGKVKPGYKRVDVTVDGERRMALGVRSRSTWEKDDQQTDVMAALAREFDRQPTLLAVIGALRAARVRRANSKGRGVWDGFWEGRDLERILLDPLYVGEWRLLGGSGVSDVWDQFKRDGLDPAEIRHEVPHLAWFTTSQMVIWREKFLTSDRPKPHRLHHEHPLLGVLACPECGTTMGRGGASNTAGVLYRCRGVQRRHASGRESIVSERMALRALRSILPEVLTHSANALQTLSANLENGSDACIQSQLTALEERDRFIRQKYLIPARRPAQWLIAEVNELETAKLKVQQQLETVVHQRELHGQMADVLCECSVDPMGAFDTLTAEQQAAAWQALVTNVKVIVSRARGRNCRAWLQEWTPVGEPYAHAERSSSCVA